MLNSFASIANYFVLIQLDKSENPLDGVIVEEFSLGK